LADRSIRNASTRNIDTAHALISRVCVNDCLFCATADKRNSQDFPDPGQVIEFIDSAHFSGIPHMIFSGLGEPTLDPNFETYLRHAGKLGFTSIRLFTNGYNINYDKAIRWKSLGLSEILLSIHGMQDGHDYVTNRSGAFKQAIAALRIFADLKYSISVNTCLTRKNLDEIKALIDFLKGFPIKIHTLSFPEWCGNVVNNLSEMLDYIQVSELSNNLIDGSDTVTCFDNMPYCLIQIETIERKGIPEAAYLDGSGENIIDPASRKLFHDHCRLKNCPYLNRCSGFEPEYIRIRGWGDIPGKIEHFFSDNGRRMRNAIITNSGNNRSSVKIKLKKKTPSYFHKEMLTVIIRPTNRCNADCAYCSSFNPQKSNGLMDFDTFGQISKKLHDYIGKTGINNVSFLWHGGEPLLAGKDFYSRVWEDISGWREMQVRHLIQTNLLLADKEWFSLFKRFEVGIGTSADPVENIRIFNDGREQYGVWIDKLISAGQSGLDVGLVFTVTAAHLGKVRLLHNFFKNIQMLGRRSIGVKVNPLYFAGKMTAGMADHLALSPDDYGKFLGQLWDIWEADRRPYPLSPFKEWLEPGRLSCEFSGRCHENFLAIDYNGRVFNCARFADSDITFGNILTDDIDGILQHESRLKLYDRQPKLHQKECADCTTWSFCHGGCPYFSRIYKGDVDNATPFCSSYKYLMETGAICNAAPKEIRIEP
jgi:uncharacterized protein